MYMCKENGKYTLTPFSLATHRSSLSYFWALSSHLGKVGLIERAKAGGGEPDEAAPPGGEAEQASVHGRGEDLESTRYGATELRFFTR